MNIIGELIIRRDVGHRRVSPASKGVVDMTRRAARCSDGAASPGDDRSAEPGAIAAPPADAVQLVLSMLCAAHGAAGRGAAVVGAAHADLARRRAAQRRRCSPSCRRPRAWSAAASATPSLGTLLVVAHRRAHQRSGRRPRRRLPRRDRPRRHAPASVRALLRQAADRPAVDPGRRVRLRRGRAAHRHDSRRWPAASRWRC